VNLSNTKLENSLWSKLAESNLVHGEMPDTTTSQTPWYIKAMQGFAGWIAAVFILAFLGTVFTWLFRMESGTVLIVLGLFTNLAAYIVFRINSENEFLHQIGLVFNLCGQLIVAFGLYEAFDSFNAKFFLILFSYQALLVMLIPDFLSRLVSTWFSMIALFFGLARMGISDVSSVLVGLAFVILWMNDHKWLKRKSVWEPIGYGLAISLLQFSGQIMFGGGFRWWLSMQDSSWFDQYSYWFNQVLVVAVFVGILVSLVKQYHIKLQSKIGLLVVVGAILLVALSHYVIGASGALFLLLVGFIKQRRLLVILGVLSLLSFISWYYYNLDVTLLTKSIIFIGFSISFFIAYYFLNLMSGSDGITFSNLKEKYKMSKIKWVAVGSMITILILINHNIYKKEHILENGKMVLLELAPVDPRSIMQGDYMRLRFSIETQMLKEDDDEINYNTIQHGYFIANLDLNNIGTFSHIDRGEELNENQVKMEYKLRYGRIYLATHAFYFQEGSASEYEKAKYGEFRVATNGELLLNNLRDESFAILGFNRPSN